MMDNIQETIQRLRASAAVIDAIPSPLEDLKAHKAAITQAIRDAELVYKALDAEGLEPEDFEAYTAERARAHAVCGTRRALGNALGIALRSMFTTTDVNLIDRELRRITAQLRRQADAEYALHTSVAGRQFVA